MTKGNDRFDLFCARSEDSLSDLAVAAQALWFAGNKQWGRAHELVQDDPSRECAWVHAYLHREEGDLDNARYWYRVARRPESFLSLADEWRELVGALVPEDLRQGAKR